MIHIKGSQVIVQDLFLTDKLFAAKNSAVLKSPDSSLERSSQNIPRISKSAGLSFFSLISQMYCNCTFVRFVYL
jgi:hypothetical protein